MNKIIITVSSQTCLLVPKQKCLTKKISKSNNGNLRNFPFLATRKIFVIQIHDAKISHVIVLYTDY